METQSPIKPPRKVDPFLYKSPRNILRSTLKRKINNLRKVPNNIASGIFERSVQPITKRKSRKTRKGRK